MSKRETKRKNAIVADFDGLEKKAAQAVSDLVAQTALLKVLIVFLHDDLLNAKGYLSEGDRIDLRDSLVPLYPQIQTALDDITDIFNIHDDDVNIWRANLDAYTLANPTILTEALSRFPIAP
jgi:hypothetical protein